MMRLSVEWMLVPVGREMISGSNLLFSAFFVRWLAAVVSICVLKGLYTVIEH